MTPTSIDLELALAFYSVLVDQARRRDTITYGELVERAQTRFPNNETVSHAIPISAGRRLDFVREFTKQRGLPDLTALVVNKDTGECGVGFTRNFDPREIRAQVFSFDWKSVSTEFTGAVAEAKERAKPRKRVKREEAVLLMSEYYATNKKSLPSGVRARREEIIELICAGFTPEAAFSKIQA